MANKELLSVRTAMRKTKPSFVVKESNFSRRIESRWRYPYGRHSKVRQMHCGRPAMPNPGYGAPAEARGLHKSGLEMVVVHNADELITVDPKMQGAIIGAGVGKKKKLSLLGLAQQKGITVLNVKDAAKSIEVIKADFEQRKELRKKKLAESGKKEEEKKKKAEERAKKEATEKKAHAHDEKNVTEQTEQERKEMEKTITKPQ